jgi:hypothetical protein
LTNLEYVFLDTGKKNLVLIGPAFTIDHLTINVGGDLPYKLITAGHSDAASKQRKHESAYVLVLKAGPTILR